MTDSGKLGAFITKVKKGSMADTVGHLRPGDQVLEWNGRSLEGATFEEVYDIISESKQEPQVELIVKRSRGDVAGIGDLSISKSIYDINAPATTVGAMMPPPTTSQQQPLPQHQQQQQLQRPSVTLTSPNQSTVPMPLSLQQHHQQQQQMLQQHPHHHPPPPHHHPHHAGGMSSASAIGGRIQIKLGHDPSASQLIVSVLTATELPPKHTSSSSLAHHHNNNNNRPQPPPPQPSTMRNPYCCLALLPDRSERGLRKTKIVSGSNEPKWNQTFTYHSVTRAGIADRSLEISLWDADRFAAAHEFIGQVVIDLANVPLDDEAQVRERGGGGKILGKDDK